MIAHEFEDSAVLKVFGQEGHGLFITPSAIEEDVCQQYADEEPAADCNSGIEESTGRLSKR
jgi:LysR family transcriptional activator of nhaA